VASSWGNPRLDNLESEPGKWLGVKGMLSEVAFRRMLSFERSRSDRTQRPFALLLLNMGRLLSSETGTEPLPMVLSVLQSTTREIDVLGWNVTNAIIGVILPEIALGNDLPVNAILSRISAALQQKLATQHFGQIGFSCQLYPEALGRINHASEESVVQSLMLQEAVAFTTRQTRLDAIKMLKRQEPSIR
jgi:hypothetical protein